MSYQEVNIQDYLDRIAARTSVPPIWSLSDEPDTGKKILTIIMHDHIILKDRIICESEKLQVYSYIIPNKNIKLIIDTFM
jgi:hypothetical protein